MSQSQPDAHMPRIDDAGLSQQEIDARNTAVAEIMTTPVRCASPDMPVEGVVSLLLDQAISAVPVVNDAGKAIGIVSKTDLLRRYSDSSGETQASHTRLRGASGRELDLGPGFHVEQASRGSVADVMSHRVYSVSMETSISQVSALMAYEGVHRVVITAQAGLAIGIVSSLDILRWLARRDGFVMPNRTRQQLGD